MNSAIDLIPVTLWLLSWISRRRARPSTLDPNGPIATAAIEIDDVSVCSRRLYIQADASAQ